jgi:hypothetical protein
MLTGGMWLRELDRDLINERSAPVELSHDLDSRPCFFYIASAVVPKLHVQLLWASTG